MVQRLITLLHTLTQRQVLLLLLLGAVGVTLGSFFMEYGLGAQPCRMCWWQRYIHWAIAACAAIGLLLPPKWRWGALGDCLWLALLGCGIAIWQSGGQLGWWNLPGVCSGSNAALGSAMDLLTQMSHTQPPNCTDWGVIIFGLSLAMWNILITLGFSALATLGLCLPWLQHKLGDNKQ